MEKSDGAEGRRAEVFGAEVTQQWGRRGELRIAQTDRRSPPDRQTPAMTAEIFQNVPRSLQHGPAGLCARHLSLRSPQGQIAAGDREAPPASSGSPLQRSQCKTAKGSGERCTGNSLHVVIAPSLQNLHTWDSHWLGWEFCTESFQCLTTKAIIGIKTSTELLNIQNLGTKIIWFNFRLNIWHLHLYIILCDPEHLSNFHLTYRKNKLKVALYGRVKDITKTYFKSKQFDSPHENYF